MASRSCLSEGNGAGNHRALRGCKGPPNEMARWCLYDKGWQMPRHPKAWGRNAKARTNFPSLVYCIDMHRHVTTKLHLTLRFTTWARVEDSLGMFGHRMLSTPSGWALSWQFQLDHGPHWLFHLFSRCASNLRTRKQLDRLDQLGGQHQRSLRDLTRSTGPSHFGAAGRFAALRVSGWSAIQHGETIGLSHLRPLNAQLPGNGRFVSSCEKFHALLADVCLRESAHCLWTFRFPCKEWWTGIVWYCSVKFEGLDDKCGKPNNKPSPKCIFLMICMGGYSNIFQPSPNGSFMAPGGRALASQQWRPLGDVWKVPGRWVGRLIFWGMGGDFTWFTIQLWQLWGCNHHTWGDLVHFLNPSMWDLPSNLWQFQWNNIAMFAIQ